MKKILLLTLFLMSSLAIQAQGGDAEDVYSSDVINPKFNGGGLDTFHRFVKDSLDYSQIKSGKNVVKFTIDVDGKLKNIKVVEFKDVNTATEIIRVLMLSPRWQCARRGGKPFSVEIKMPFVFN